MWSGSLVSRLVEEFQMFPIERITVRAQAYSILGVSRSATLDDIREAYRELAVRKNPGQHPEFTDEFARITEAYQCISEYHKKLCAAETEPANVPTAPRKVSLLNATETRFDADTRSECRALLDSDGGPGALHVATKILRRGRRLSYFVDTAIKPGLNEVAVPTGMLEDSRRVLPRIIAFESCETKGGRYELPPEQCARHFPGARAISIRFAAD